MYFDAKVLPKFLRFTRKGCLRIIRHKVDGIASYFRRSGYEQAVIGLSGGIDSALSLALTTRALGPENVTAVRLPSGASSQASLTIAKEVADSCGLPERNLITVNVEPVVKRMAFLMSVIYGDNNVVPAWFSKTPSELRLGNMAARTRMMALMDVATWKRALLVGTENRTEHALAYFTIGGDSVSNFEPFLDLWKVQVFQVADALGLPKSVLDRAPSAELWHGQTDEDELGVPYPVIDTVLAGVFDEGMTEAKVISELGIDPEHARKVLDRVERMRGKRESPFPFDVPDHEFLDFDLWT